jgi:imidazoleglycerol-phosphate dehydratase/histidinol-phosphatase
MKALFVDRDGTLIEEPPDEQVDALEKVRFLPGVFAALSRLRDAGYTLVMVTNQDGLGTPSFPADRFELPQAFVLEAFRSQGLEFEAVFVCPHTRQDGCRCRKPGTALVDDWIRERGVDLATSAMIGDRDTDLKFAENLGIRGIRVLVDGDPAQRWPAIATELLARRATVERVTRETAVRVSVDLDHDGTPHRLLRSHARTVGQARWIQAGAGMQRRPRDRRTPHHRGLRPRARRSPAQGLG